MVLLYTKKTDITVADMLNDKVLPFFNERALSLLRVLTGRGTSCFSALVSCRKYQTQQNKSTPDKKKS